MTQTDQAHRGAHAWTRLVRRAALVLAGLLAAVVVPPSTAEAATVPVTITASRAVLTAGEVVRFTGVVSPARPGGPVALQAFTSAAWRTVAATTLNSRSRYQFTLKPVVGDGVRYRVRTTSLGSLPAASAARTVTALPQPRIAWSFTRTSVAGGEAPTIRWRTSSLPTGYRVVLQRRTPGAATWTTVMALGRSGTSRIPASMTGRFRYRAVVVAPTRAQVATSTHILTVRPLAAACRQDVVATSVCRFVIAVQTDDVTGLSTDERRVAARANGLPRRSWTPGACELVGDVTVRCDVRFTGVAPVVAQLLLQPTNGDFRDGVIVLPPGVALRYGVVDYLGLKGSSAR